MTVDVLTTRALNRALLARQLLLERSDRTPLDAVEHLVGLQAQIPLNPYVGLWSRLCHFRPDDLARLLLDREVVRLVVMRATIHLVTAADCLELRPLMQPVLEGEMVRHPDFGPALKGVDLTPVLAHARALLAERPRSQNELRAEMAAAFPDLDAAALTFACRIRLAFVQVPPRGVWGKGGQVTGTTAETWLGRPLAAHPSIDAVVLRYLAAFGPASAADVATWSRLAGIREVLDRLRPKLRAFHDEKSRELLDLPEAPRPDPETPAPPRFFPEYDNVLLSHSDRSRIIPDAARARLSAGPGPVHGSVLHDGFGFGTWSLTHDKTAGTATLVIHHGDRLTKRAESAIGAESRRLLRLLAPGVGHDVRFVALG